MRLVAKAEKWKLAEVFTISRGSRTETELVTVTLYDGTFEGRGNAWRILDTMKLKRVCSHA